MATKKRSRKQPTHRDPVDEQAATELVMYIENTSDLSPDGPSGQGRSVLLNALRKWKKGTYDPALGVKLFGYLAEAGAKRYAKEFGSPRDWSTMFNPATRHEAARQLEESFRNSAQNGEYDHVDTRIGEAHEVENPEPVYEPQEHTVADFNTMDDLIAHARDELGATHVTVAGTKSKIYFPHIGEHAYEAASVRIKNGYWHADGPGAREGVRNLPASARPIGGGRQRAAEHVEGRRNAASTLPVIFRAEKSGDAKGEVTAVFPTLPGTGPNDFTVYAHIGQHSTGTQGWYVQTRAATPAEYASLLAELKRIYEHGPGETMKLQVVERFTRHYDDERRRNAGTHEARVDPHNTVANNVRDYIAVDSRGRTLAGPFKGYSEAKHAAGPAGHVEYVRETGTAGVFEVDEGTGVAARRGRDISHNQVMTMATDLSKKVQGTIPKSLIDPNDEVGAKFLFYSPGGQLIVVFLSRVDDVNIALDIYSDEGTRNRYENISTFLYGPDGYTSKKVSLKEMTETLEWVQKTVDEYADSWDNDVDEARPRPKAKRSAARRR